MMGLEYFNLEGVDGQAKTWKEFGKWWSDKILVGTDELPEETKVKMKALVGGEKDPIIKAKIYPKIPICAENGKCVQIISFTVLPGLLTESPKSPRAGATEQRLPLAQPAARWPA